MGSSRLSVTIPAKLAIELEKLNLSPSKLLQDKIREELSAARGDLDNNVKELNRKVANWVKVANNLRDFITSKGLLDEFLAKHGA